MRLWHWLTTQVCSDYVIARWEPKCRDDPSLAAKKSVHDRFCGTGSCGGVARNALSRLYWIADSTVVDGDYSLTAKIFSQSDLLVGIFERQLGLETRLARSCIRQLSDLGEPVHRPVLRILNYTLSTVVVEALSDQEVDELVDECLQLAP